ncbi:MAG: hypothetical protein ACK5NS_17000, partial [Denitromonas sp.]
MSGLFRRLARQVAGPRPATVHAMARLPFHAPPAPVSADEGGTLMPLAHADPAPVPPSATAARSTHPAAPARSRRHGHAEPASPAAPVIDTPAVDTPA